MAAPLVNMNTWPPHWQIRNKGPSIQWILLILSVLLCLNGMRALVHEADKQPFFSDEYYNNRAITDFFAKGIYTTEPQLREISPAVSTGIAGTWPAALGWAFGSSLLSARVALGLALFTHLFVLVIVLARSRGWTYPSSLLAGSLTWALSLKVIPWWHGFLLCLGEFDGALWIATGLVILFHPAQNSVQRKNRIALMGVCLGIAVWLTKFIYLPMAIGIGLTGLVPLLASKNWPKDWKSFQSKAFSAVPLFLYGFGIPLLAWILFIASAHGLQAAIQYPIEYFNLLTNWKSADHGEKVMGLIQRLHSAQLEWSHYPASMKAKILFLSVGTGSVLFIYASALWHLQKRKAAALFTAVIASVIFVFSYQWFFYHPAMWVRHLQPTLLLGFFSLLYLCAFEIPLLLTGWIGDLARRLAILLFAVFCVFQTHSAWKFEVFQPTSTFARECRDLKKWECKRELKIREP